MKCISMSVIVFYFLYSETDKRIFWGEYRIGSNTTLTNTKKWHEGFKALAKVVIILWWYKRQKHFRAVHKVVAFYCLRSDYRIREVKHLKEHNSSLMMPEIPAIVVVTIRKDRMPWITMSKPNMKIFVYSCIVLHNRFTNVIKIKVRMLD